MTDSVPTLSFRDVGSDAFARAIGDAYGRYGFVIVTDHGIPQPLIDRFLDLYRRFFALPTAAKQAYRIPGGGGARGYTPFGIETAKGATHHDLKEFWHVGRELAAGHPHRQYMRDNIWVDELPGFRECSLEMFEAFDATGRSLLRAIAGLLLPDAGTVAFQDGDGNRLDERQARGRETHFIGHLDGLKGARTARDELAFQCDWLGHTQDGVDEAIETFGLKPLLDLEVRKLSAGQRRRLALGRLVGSPRALWLLDEPMGPLDARWRAVFAEVMQRHLRSDGLILAAVHDALPMPVRTLDLGGLG